MTVREAASSAAVAREGGLGGRIAVVTGAGQGIGAAIAQTLFNDGAMVAAVDIDMESARASVRRFDADGKYAFAGFVDVRDRAALETVMDQVEKRWGRVDIMINNAALNLRTPFDELDEAEWDDVLAVNLRGVLYGCQVASRRMRRTGFGRIINITSDAGQQPNAFVGAHYAASKAGIIALTKVAALELAPHGVTVNAIAPAAVDGPVLAGLPEEQVETLLKDTPVGRFGRPEEVGALAAFLAGDAAGYITGATYDINGGRMMR